MTFPTFSLEALRARQGAKWQRFGPDVIPCWVADMDFPLAPPIRQLLAEAVAREEFGYPLKSDAQQVAEQFARRMARRFDWQVEAADCCVVTDVVQAMYVVMDRFTEPGDGVVLNPPLYPPFYAAIRENGREIISNPLINNQSGWQLDVDSLAAAITPGTRMLALCNPHNPSGRVFRRHELEAVGELALAHDLVVMCDEIHADLVYDGHRHLPFASLSPQLARRTITFNSATKAFNIAGLRAAVVHFGAPELKARFESLPSRLLGGLPCYAARITAVAWSECDDWLHQALAYLQANRDYLARFLAEELPAVRFHSPEATYLAWLDFRGCELAEDPHAFFLREARIALSPGPDFGAGEGRGCARLNFATDRALLGTVLERMASALAAR